MVIKIGTNRQNWPNPALFIALVFQIGLEDRNAAAKRLNGDDSMASRINLYS